MRERLKRLMTDFKKAFNNLEIAAKEAEDDLEIDGAIKRFELCYELSWKLIKEYLSDSGIICNNPRDCFKYAYQNELINSDEIWLKMINDRNLLVHTYTREESREIFERIKNDYLGSFQELLKICENYNE